MTTSIIRYKGKELETINELTESFRAMRRCLKKLSLRGNATSYFYLDKYAKQHYERSRNKKGNTDV